MEAAFGGSDAEGAGTGSLPTTPRGGAWSVPAPIRPGDARPRRVRPRRSSPAHQARRRCCRRRPDDPRNPEHFEQFSTPIPLGFALAAAAAHDRVRALVLEPSAGTGLLAIFADLARGAPHPQRAADTRAGLLGEPVPHIPVTLTRCGTYPRPPRRRSAARSAGADEPALLGARRMSRPGSPMPPCATSPRPWRALPRAGASSQSPAPILSRTSRLARRFRAAPGARSRSVSAGDRWPGLRASRHDDRYTPDRRRPRARRRIPAAFPAIAGHRCRSGADLLDWVSRLVPPRPVVCHGAHGRCPLRDRPSIAAARALFAPRRVNPVSSAPSTPSSLPTSPAIGCTAEGIPLRDPLYEPYALQSIRISGAHPHPTRLGSRPRWLRWHPAAAATAASARPIVAVTGRSRRAARERRPMPARRIPAISPVRWIVDDTFDVVSAAPEAGESRGCRRRRPVPPRLVSRRRHRRRQGPPGRRHHPRQLAEGPPSRRLALQIRQIDRRRAARLVGAGPGAPPASRRSLASGKARRSGSAKASSSSPTPRCARRSARRRPRASSRSSSGSAATSTASSSSTN